MIIFLITSSPVQHYKLWGSDPREVSDPVDFHKVMLFVHPIGEPSPENHLLDETSSCHVIVVVLVVEEVG